MDEARQVNVARSRAKKTLILVGNSKTLMDWRSHFDGLFNYTKMYRNLVTLSKNEEKGNIIDINNLSAENKFNQAKEKLKVGLEYNCAYKNSVNLGDDQLHLFKIDNLIDGALFDKRKTKSFVVNE